MTPHHEADDVLHGLLAQSGYEITRFAHQRDGSYSVKLRPKDAAVRMLHDESAHTVSIGGKSLALSPVTYAIAESLIDARGTVVKGETLIKKIWGKPSAATRNRLSVHMHHLRRALADHGIAQSIRNVHGFGFYLM